MKNNIRLYTLLIVLALLSSACNLPSNVNSADAASTAAAQTIEALLSSTPPTSSVVINTPTFTPAAVPATLTPIPLQTNTSVPPTASCNIMQFVTDVTYADGATVTPGQNFTKTWRLKNAGTCAWTPSYAIVFADGNSLNGPSTQALTGTVNPGQTIDISVNLTAPATLGDYTGNWKIKDASGVLFGKFYVQIKVQNSVTATATGTIAAPFSVTSVTYILGTWSDAGHTNCPRVTANITTNGAGNVNYEWKASSGTNPTQILIFASAGTQSINYDWARGSANNGTLASVGIYIGSPNNQDFGKLDFTTACIAP